MARKSESRSALELRLELEDFEPLIWREIRVDEAITLAHLHRVIQVAMGWLDYHLYDFEIRSERYEHPDEEAEGKDATRAHLARFGFEVGDTFSYRYDWGDDWTLRVEVLGRTMVDRNAWLPFILGGERAGPPEDAGGIGGLAALLEALADPGHPEHQSYRDWVGDDFDPEHFDPRAANAFLWLATGWGAIRPPFPG